MPQEKVPTSIHKGLLTSLAVVLLSCLLALVAAAYLNYMVRIKQDIQKQADLYIESVSNSLERLLWTMDSEAIINVGLYYQSFQDVSAMEVVDSFGQTVFAFDKALPDALVTRDAEVTYEGTPVGSIHLAMSTASSTDRVLEMFRVALTLALIVGGVMLVCTHFILRRYLRKPLSHLNALAQAYSSSDFDLEEPRSPSKEFQGVVSALSRMGRTIKAQISKLQEAEAAYRSIFENIVEGLVQTLSNGVISKLNPAMAQMLGYDSPEHALNQGVITSTAIYSNPEDRRRLLEMLMEKGEVRGFETELTHRDGKRIAVSIHSRGTFAKGRLICIDSVVENITERKQAEQALQRAHQELEDRVEQRTRELKQANDRLRNLDELKSSLLSAVSHDIRTPLTSVLGFAKLAHRDFSKHFAPDAAKDKVKEARSRRIFSYLDTIVEEGGRLTRLINDYLDLSKIESGRVDWDDQDLDVGELLSRALKALEFVVDEASDLTLTTRLDDGLPKIHADYDRMLQVLVNLLDNAVKYTRSGEILIEAGRDARGRLRITVTDTGRGIPEADLFLVFEKFHQVERTDTVGDTPKGTGLGLAICKQIVEHYGGEISVASTLGRGSAFTIVLPAAD